MKNEIEEQLVLGLLIWVIVSLGIFYFGKGGGALKYTVQTLGLSPTYTLLLDIIIQTLIYLLAFTIVLRLNIRYSLILLISFIALGFATIVASTYLLGLSLLNSISFYILNLAFIEITVVIIIPFQEDYLGTSGSETPAFVIKREEDYIILGFLVFAFLGLLFFGYISVQDILLYNANTNSTIYFSTLNTSFFRAGNVTLTTVNTIKAGRYTSALSKTGLGGQKVAILGVKILQITRQVDGDYHMIISSATGNVLDTELTPLSNYYYNVTLNNIGVNSTIDMVGYYYCDIVHSAEQAHSGGSCAEIHPITYLSMNNVNATLPSKFTFIPEQNLEP